MQFKNRKEVLDYVARLEKALGTGDDRGDEHVIDAMYHYEDVAFMQFGPMEPETKTNKNSLREVERDLSRLFGGAF